MLTKNCSPEFAERALGHCWLPCRGVVVLVIYFTSKWPIYQLEGINMSHKGPNSQSYGFSNRELDVKKAECQSIDAFELWCWRRLLRVPWTARKSNQSILKEISPQYSLEGLMLKPKLQYFGHLMQRTDSLGKILMPTQWTWVWVNSRSWWWTGRPSVLQSTGSQGVRHDWVTELNWWRSLILTGQSPK